MENLSTKKLIILNESLDLSKNEFQNILQKTSDIILHQYENVDRRKGFNSFPQKGVESWFDEPLPFSGENIFQIIKGEVYKYSITPYGMTLKKLITEIEMWRIKHRDKIMNRS